MSDTKKRSAAKSLSWRLLAIFVLAAVSFFITRDVQETSIITLFYHLIQIAAFMIHERVWNQVAWGRSRGIFIQMTGLSGSGKSTIAKALQLRLQKKGYRVEVIDGDEYREGLCSDLGFSKEDRNTNIRRLGFVGKVLARNNVVTIMSAINPYEEIRAELRKMSDNVKTVFVDCDIETLKKRDTKGLYRRALLPDGHPEKIEKFTGISDPFDAPFVCDLKIDTASESEEQSVSKLEQFIIKNIA